MKKTIAQVDKKIFSGKRVLVRVDFNVPQDEAGNITDDTRIRAALPTVEYLQAAGAKLILMSHLGQPKAKSDKFSLKRVAKRLQELLPTGKVIFSEDSVGEIAEKAIAQLNAGDICLLENTRFHPEEEKNDPAFAKKVARLGEVYVNDAFGSAHRAHVSTEGVAHFSKPALAGFLIEKEVKMLSETFDNPPRPFATVIGGAKVSSKIAVLDRLLTKANKLVIGGAMAFTFLKARGLKVGRSLVEESQLAYCQNLEKQAKEKGVALVLPVDVVCANEMKEGARTWVVSIDKIPDDAMGLDIGPESIKEMVKALKDCRTILWNGPMGVFEIPGLEKGTYALIDELVNLCKTGTKVIVGGGDSVAALGAKGVDDKALTHVSTGGGASLELLEGKELPGIACLDDAEVPVRIK